MNGKPVFTVPARTIINFKSGFGKKLLCDDMTFTAGSACVYSCSFCYVESMQKKQKAWFEQHGVVYPQDGHFGVVIRNAEPVEIARRQIRSKPETFLRAKHVIYSSPKVDVAANMELVRETVGICKMILRETDWQIRLLSKSNLLPKIAESMDGPAARNRVIYGVSTGTLDDKLAAAFEEGTPKVSKRIESLHWLQDNGFRTFGMICPSLPQRDYFKFALDMAQAIRADRCEHVWAEVINVRGDSFERTHNALECAGFTEEADALHVVSSDPKAWEQYARLTFEGHANLLVNKGKLRFLQYVNKSNIGYWHDQQTKGAVLL